jgi:hypothetical protein
MGIFPQGRAVGRREILAPEFAHTEAFSPPNKLHPPHHLPPGDFRSCLIFAASLDAFSSQHRAWISSKSATKGDTHSPANFRARTAWSVLLRERFLFFLYPSICATLIAIFLPEDFPQDQPTAAAKDPLWAFRQITADTEQLAHFYKRSKT